MSYNRYKPKAAEIDVLRSETNGERKKKFELRTNWKYYQSDTEQEENLTPWKLFSPLRLIDQ